jgi:hypothetical protein
VEPPGALRHERSAAARVDAAAAALEDRRRMLQNLAALAVVLVLVVLGAWMIERLRIYSRTMACIEAGHRSCLQLDVERSPGR